MTMLFAEARLGRCASALWRHRSYGHSFRSVQTQAQLEYPASEESEDHPAHAIPAGLATPRQVLYAAKFQIPHLAMLTLGI